MVAGADDDAVVGPLQRVRLSLRHFGPAFPGNVRLELRYSSYGNVWPISRIVTLRTAVMRFWEDMMKFLAVGLGALALAFGINAASAQTVKIGIMLPFSGVNADLGDAQIKGFDLYMKLHAKDLEPYKLDIVKRDEGPPSGANAKTVATELITRRESEADRRRRVLAISDRDCAGDDAGQGAVDYFQRWHSLDHHPVALHRALLVQHVASGLSDGHVCGQDAWLQDRRHGLHGFPARQGLRPTRSRPASSKPAARSSTRSPWATRRRCRTSRRSSSA